MSNDLRIGSRIRLSGGYFYSTEWLCGATHHDGEIVDFLSGKNEQPAALVRLDSKINVEGVLGDLLVLELRHGGATWAPTGFVHIEFCDFVPEHKPWTNRRQGTSVESAASYERLNAEP